MRKLTFTPTAKVTRVLMDEKNKPMSNKTGDDYCTTRQAAEMLGISLGTVQQMVESGVLAAWKTDGGHRRVSVSAINAHLNRRLAAPFPSGKSGNPMSTANSPGQVNSSNLFSILIAEDDLILQKLYKITMAGWGLPIEIRVVSNGFEGLVQIGQHPPDLVILDLMMPGIDGFEMIRTLRGNPALAEMDIIVVTGMSPDHVVERGGLPAGTTLYGKPIPFHQLHGYLEARLARRQRTLAG
jgi:excisionase family DNA binding protein